MKVPTIAACLMIVASLPVVTGAQPEPVLSFDFPALTHDDLDRMHAAAARLLKGRTRPIGASERWHGRGSGHDGEVRFVRGFNVNGIPCRTLDYSIRNLGAGDGDEDFILNWCLVPGEGWKIVEYPMVRAENELP